MRMSKLLKEIKELTDINIKVLALEIADILKEYDNYFHEYGKYKKLSNKDKTIVGLAYSEFLTDDRSNEELFVASEKSDILRKQLGIKHTELLKLVDKYL